MKKFLIVIGLALFTVPMVYGVIITNTNQSTQYIRLLSRNASMLIDAVYYNPAGVVHLDNGFHLALHNQSIQQEKTVINDFPFLNSSEYVGNVKVPIFPSFFAVYKTGSLPQDCHPSKFPSPFYPPHYPSWASRLQPTQLIFFLKDGLFSTAFRAIFPMLLMKYFRRLLVLDTSML